MMHKDTRELDKWESLCSIPEMIVQRIRMRDSREAKDLRAESMESVVIPVKGSVRVEWGEGEGETLGEKDVCYLPVGSSFDLYAEGESDILWARAPAGEAYGPYVKRFSEIKPVVSGSQSYTRHIYTAIGEQDRANRLLLGFVEGEPGNWTSFPPHKHDGKPEVYVYYGMGERFGVQVVAGDDDKAFLVREGDAVLFEKGYHPNVATPGVGMNFVWIISADPKSRTLAVDVHPVYKDMPMGQTHLTIKNS